MLGRSRCPSGWPFAPDGRLFFNELAHGQRARGRRGGHAGPDARGHRVGPRRRRAGPPRPRALPRLRHVERVPVRLRGGARVRPARRPQPGAPVHGHRRRRREPHRDRRRPPPRHRCRTGARSCSAPTACSTSPWATRTCRRSRRRPGCSAGPRPPLHPRGRHPRRQPDRGEPRVVPRAAQHVRDGHLRAHDRRPLRRRQRPEQRRRAELPRRRQGLRLADAGRRAARGRASASSSGPRSSPRRGSRGTLPATFGGDYADNVFVAGYVEADLRRIALSGPQLLDIDLEAPFAAWSNVGFANKPLAITTGPNGTLYVSTFDAIYRFRKAP